VGQFAYCLICSLGRDAMHRGGKDSGGPKEKQMYNNKTAKNKITKKYNLLTYTFIICSIFLRKSVCTVSVKVF